MKTYRYLIDICYDGRSFYGFQSQPNGNTIQDHLEKALMTLKLLNGRIIGSSRTDSQVSAYHQVCVFKSNTSITDNLDKILLNINALLPRSICVFNIKVIDDNFDIFKDHRGKIYRYIIFNGKKPDNPNLFDKAWLVKKPINLDILTDNLTMLIGCHDFSSFSKSDITTNTDISQKNNIRTIYNIKVFSYQNPLVLNNTILSKSNLHNHMKNQINIDSINLNKNHNNYIEIWCHGQGFLRHMIRIIVGSCVYFACNNNKNLALKNALELLNKKDRIQSFITAPAHALCLIACLFDHIYPNPNPNQNPSKELTLLNNIQKSKTDYQSFYKNINNNKQINNSCPIDYFKNSALF